MFDAISKYNESALHDASVLVLADRKVIGYTVAFVHGASMGFIASGITIAAIGGIMKVAGADDEASTELMVVGGKAFALGTGLALVNKGVRIATAPKVATEAGAKPSEMSTLAKRFVEVHGAENAPILTFKKEWENGTGYLNGLFADKSITALKDGCYSSMDSHGRKVIIRKNGTEVLAMFQRYTDNGEDFIVQDSTNSEHTNDEKMIGAVAKILG